MVNEAVSEAVSEVRVSAADVVTARACATLDEHLAWAAPIMGETEHRDFLNGTQAEEELTQAGQRWTMRVAKRGSISDPAGTILIITQLKRNSQ